MPPIHRFTLPLLALLTLGSCSSISKGVAEAVLEQKKEDTRKCEITSPPFSGLRASLDAQTKGSSAHTTKILMVHGVSEHLPGYSTRLRVKLAQTLGLDTLDGDVREIKLTDPKFKLQDGTLRPLGTLRISRLMTSARDKELLFYELTWSNLTDPQKTFIKLDSSDAFNFQRAGINSNLKAFINGTVPDLLIYLGNQRPAINASVQQSLCWMFRGDWTDLPESGTNSCSQVESPKMANTIAEDDYYFITHSLGSRIAVDTVEYYSQMLEQSSSPEIAKIREVLKQKQMTIFMLANQLSLLQVGQEEPTRKGDRLDYCGDNAPRKNERIYGKLPIIAFSDPNDILSYPIADEFAERYLDARFCPEISNVNLNISHVHDILGAADFADPLGAHQGYLEDDRVINIITDGISRSKESPEVYRRCNWMEIVPKERR